MAAKIRVNLQASLEGHRQSIYALATNETGKLFSAGGDGFVAAWNFPYDANGKLFAQCPEPIYAMCFHPESGLICGSASGAVYQITEGEEPRKWLAHDGSVYVCKALMDGGLLTAAGDGTLIIWNAEMAIVSRHKISDKSVRTAIYSKAEESWYFGCSDWNIYLTNAQFQVLDKLEGHTQSVFALALDEKKARLLSGGRDAVLRVWDLKNHSPIAHWNAHWFHIHALQTSPDGHWLASGSMDKTIRIWDLESDELLKEISAPKMQAHKSSVNALIWLSNNLLVSAGDDRIIRVWELTAES